MINMRTFTLRGLIPIMVTAAVLAQLSIVPFLAGESTADHTTHATTSWGGFQPVRTRWGTFAIDEIGDLVWGLPDDSESNLWLVQMRTPVEKETRIALKDTGVRIISYIPEGVYLIDRQGVDPYVFRAIPEYLGDSHLPSGLKTTPELLYAFLFDPGRGEILGVDSISVSTFESDRLEREMLQAHSGAPVWGAGTRYILKLPIVDLDVLLSREWVRWVEPEYPNVLHNNVSSEITGVEVIWDDLGLNGTGQIIGIGDSGLDTGVDDHLVNGDIMADFDNRATIMNFSWTSASDENGHGTHVAGSVAGDGSLSSGEIRGMAYNSSIYFSALGIGTSSYVYPPSNLSYLFQLAYDNGSRIHTNSWGSSVGGQYTSNSRYVDEFLFQHPDMIILFSAGNSGEDSSPQDGKIDADSIGAPGTAKNCITVGASESYRLDEPLTRNGYTWGTAWPSDFPDDPVKSDRLSDNTSGIAAFSSRGPTDDGRLKPDVVTPGTAILSTKSSLVTPSWYLQYSHNSNYQFNLGTSMACPLTAGMAGLVRQYYTDLRNISSPGGALIKATIINGAMDLTPGQYGDDNATTQEVNRRPDNDQGWGRTDLKGSLQPYKGSRLIFHDDRTGLETKDEMTLYFRVNSSQELRATLSWLDYPSELASSKNLVNDLDLELISPNGTVYNGNDLTYPYDDTRDDGNTTEGISIKNPAVGWWKVRINGSNVPMGPQHYAFVITGNVSDFGATGISMDRSYYSTDGDLVTLEVVEWDLNGTGSIDIKVTSDTNTTGIDISLDETDIGGVFRGGFLTWNSSTSNTSRLHVSHNDTINASYTHGGTDFTHAQAKSPVRIFLSRGLRMYLVHSENETLEVRGSGPVNTSAFWKVDNLTMEWQPLPDDGNLINGDEKKDDGNYSDDWAVPSGVDQTSDLVVKVLDPFLGERTYPQFPVAFNCSVPRFPANITSTSHPEGRGVFLHWDNTDEIDIDHYSLYVNRTPIAPINTTAWKLVSNISAPSNGAYQFGLMNGLEYRFTLVAVDTNGNTSSPGLFTNVTPTDTTPPSVILVTTSYTISGIGKLEFTSSNMSDLALVEIEYYNDTNDNGIKDDPGQSYQPAAIGPPPLVRWDTREEAGGPGNMTSIILRYRGLDLVPNYSEWKEVSGFGVDNTPPAEVYIISPPPRKTNVRLHNVEVVAEAHGYVVTEVNGAERSNDTVGASGRYDLHLTLDEGYNNVVLYAYDRHHAGPTTRAYQFTLDTMRPVASVDVEDPAFIEREITVEGTLFNSTSYDLGLDPAFAHIDNLTWTMKGPSGSVLSTGYGATFLVRFQNMGLHELNLTVRDMSLNRNWTTLVVNVTDRTPPDLVVVRPDVIIEDSAAHFSLEGTLDNDPNWKERQGTGVFWLFDNGEWNDTFDSFDIWVGFPDPGVYSMNVSVTDGSGNTGYLNSTFSVLDITPPNGNIEGPADVIIGNNYTYVQNMTDNHPDFPSGASFKWNLTYLSGGQENMWSALGEGDLFNFDFTLTGTYTLTLNALDASGNSVNISLAIFAEGDITPPLFQSISPEPDPGNQFPENMEWTLVFNEVVTLPSVEGALSLASVNGGEGRHPVEVEQVDGMTFKVRAANLSFGTEYTLVLEGGVRDLWDNPLAEGGVWNYTVRTLFSLDFPEGVHPSSTGVNFSHLDNITLRFTNPFQLSSIESNVFILAVQDEVNNSDRYEVSFEVAAGEDPYTALLYAQLEPGVLYNISVEEKVRDIYGYNIDAFYQWEFRTYEKPSNGGPVEPPEEEPEEDEDLDPWKFLPILIAIVIGIVLLIILISVIAGAIRRRRMKRIWDSGGSERSPGEEEAEAHDEGEKGAPGSPDTTAETDSAYLNYDSSVPTFEDLYGVPQPTVEKGAGEDNGIVWDGNGPEEATIEADEDSDEDWDDEEWEEDWED